jgi:putative intracellular protease/amidase
VTGATVVIADNDVPAQGPLPVLLVIANDDFYYQEYADPRRELEAAGIPVVVAAGRRQLSTPHQNSGQGAGSGQVMPDIALAEANAANYSAIVFVGGWGATQYQYAFPGIYTNPIYNGSAAIRASVNTLINAFVAQDKFVAGVCHGVSVLAWARVNGQSPLQNRVVTTAHFNSPASNIPAASLYRTHSEVNGATVYTGGVLGNAAIRHDDVVVDGRFITGENFDSAALFGRTVAAYVRNGSTVSTVSVTSPDTIAAEQNLDPATLVVARAGVTSHAQVVRYQTSGTAVNGIDYRLLPGRLLFQPGQSQGTISVIPIDDASDEATKDLLFALLADPAYGLGSLRSSLLTILDND